MRITFVVAIFLGAASSQLIIPPRPLGYIYNNGSFTAPIHMDVHMGPLCPDSAAAFPNIKQVADFYTRAMLKLTLHMFPLPYHRQSYFTATGAQVVRKLSNTAKAFDYFNEIYTHLDELSNDNTASMNVEDVIGKLGTMAQAVGIDRSSFMASIKMESFENEVRTAWKYTCSRGIAGTPTFLINDVEVDADPTWTLTEWRKVIDPLLQQQEENSDYSTCPVDTKKCEYLPGKVECCTKGENCIPNVGCRCFQDDCDRKAVIPIPEEDQMSKSTPLV